jgi:hypothetical protein
LDQPIFVSCNVKITASCTLKISTAKSGEYHIIATNIGDICLNTWSEQGQPISIVLQQDYLISEALRNLLSVLCLAKQKFQIVLPSENSMLLLAFMTVVMAISLNKTAFPLSVLTIFTLQSHLPTAPVCPITIHGQLCNPG